uniref:Uncharacterized protein n=1 Tax=Siphoviridae sp. ctdvJ3 TaxID=2827903 RepID=A0A8S5SC13_9CAUD|nr:MAG TPA: hypothetical protein [Siphoviridae sp. ctdvJ3]DAG53760.1 MAG TPA: hypothetical protein [Caudoviricetes sp.]DAQ84882.1 MAG TPA: hypothetical protein [Caudoviricetes sp.]DAX60049.1 MAG TPA: hypothetical protein [Caudoviricetes sp.]
MLLVIIYHKYRNCQLLHTTTFLATIGGKDEI